MSSKQFRNIPAAYALAAVPLVAPIQNIQPDDIVIAHKHESNYYATVSNDDDLYIPGWQDYDYLDITPETWQIGKFIITEEDGGLVEIEANRPKEWFEDYELKDKGDKAFIVIEEMGVSDYAVLQSIRPTIIDTRDYALNESGQVERPVITTYKRIANEVWDYSFSNGKTIGCTPNHPFYSSDRQAYVPVGELSFGQTVQTAGERAVKFIGGKARDRGEYVYNFEVWREHNYYVGFEGSEEFVLVHNNCIKQIANAADEVTLRNTIKNATNEVDDIVEEIVEEIADEGAEEAIKKGRKLTWPELQALWKRGNDFNKKARDNDWYDVYELHLKNGKRLDSYDHDLGEIVSRKATDFDNIEKSTFEKYLKEIDQKYAPGTEIRSNAYPDLDGELLHGQKILEVPASNQSASKLSEFQALADQYNTVIRFRPE